MSPKRGDRAAPPPVAGEYDLRFAGGEAATGTVWITFAGTGRPKLTE